MNESMFHGAIVTMAIVLLIVIFYTVWQGLVIDMVRQRAFEVRDNAMLWAVDNGKIDSTEYRDFREIINTSIRYYNEMSLPKIIAMIFFRVRAEKDPRKDSGHAFLTNEHLKKEFSGLVLSMTMGLMLRSFIGMTAMIVALPLVMISFILNGRAKKSTAKIAGRINEEVQIDILLAA